MPASAASRRFAPPLAALLLFAAGRPSTADDAATEFFEKQVRPILVARCYECHSDKAANGCWQPIKAVPPPSIQNPKSKIQNPIDAFILAKLEPRGLSPASPADPRTLIRRAYFDLLGMPPPADELERFLAVSPSLFPS